MLHKIGKKYVWEGGYQTKDIPKNAGMKWSPKVKQWESTNIEVALKLYEYASDKIKPILKTELKLRKLRYELSSLASDVSGLEYPAPDGLAYFEYQKIGILYGYNTPKVLIADEMGLGKSIQAIGILNMIKADIKVIIIAPASLLMNWEHELKKWLVKPLSIRRITPTSKKYIDADIYIISYDMVKSCNWINSIKHNVIIADESHKLKNSKSQRADACAAIINKSARVIMLTGTPILNRPIELYNQLRLLKFPDSYYEYATRYCLNDKLGWGGHLLYDSAKNLDELQKRLRSICMIRRMKADVLSELPDKIRSIVYLDSTNYEEFMIQPEDALELLTSYGIKKAIQMNYSNDDNPLMTMRKNLGIAKIKDAIEHIKLQLESVDKIVVFVRHVTVIETLYDTFKDISVKFRGGMKAEDKDQSVRRFQNDRKINLFFGSLDAAGVGLTLTAASLCIFVEYDWTPSTMNQAEDRLHRIGQKDSVNCQYLVADGTLDTYMIGMLLEKHTVISSAINLDT